VTGPTLLASYRPVALAFLSYGIGDSGTPCAKANAEKAVVTGLSALYRADMMASEIPGALVLDYQASNLRCSDVETAF